MGRKNHNARSELRSERTFQPILSARHPIVENDENDFFFADARVVLEKVMPPEAEMYKGRERKRGFFILYDDPEKAGISILEQRLARTQAQRQRIRWTKGDVGRIRGEIQDELARLDLSGRPLSVTFTDVVRLGDAEERRSRKLALIPDQASTVAGFFCDEHETAVNGLAGSMKRFRYPYAGQWVPHWTVARVNREVPYEKMNQAVVALKNLLPFTVEVDPLKFISEQEITHKVTSNGMVWDSDTSV